jgi:hypothetical protein
MTRPARWRVNRSLIAGRGKAGDVTERSGADAARLSALVTRQRQELDRARSEAARHRAFGIFGLLESLLDGFLFARALRGDDGEVADFRIDHVSSRFRDPAGRSGAELTGRPLLEMYPEAARAGGLFDRCVTALETGEPQHVAGEMVAAPTGGADAVPAAVRIARLHDGVAIAWRGADEADRLATLLQQAITPRSSEPVAAAGLDVAARYRPAGPGNLVSGDWYDTVLLPSKDVLVVVGDIAGHGLDAVTGMVAVRNGLRGLSVTGAGPATLLGWLNLAACHFSDGVIGTAVCGLYDPASRSLRWARAGHLPPILVHDGQARALSLPQGLLLGADPDACYTELTTPLQLGDTLLLFTDGLIERRDQPIDDALDSLLRIAGRPVGDVGSYADYVVAEAASNTDDDACLVVVHVR